MKNNRNVIIWLSILLLGLGFFNYYYSSSHEEQITQVNFSDFVGNLEDGKVSTVFIKGYNIRGKMHDGTIFKTYVPFQDDSIINRLLDNKVEIIAAPPGEQTPSLLTMLLYWFPTLLYIVVLLYISRASFRGGISKSKAKKADEKHPVRFKDVGAVEEQKVELMEIVDFLKNPKKYQKLGAQIPKGVLLVGPPGTGKTMLARAVAGEANVPFFYMSGSSFVEMYVGVGAARVRELFTKALAQSPCIIFIDEIDALGRQRGDGGDGGSKEFERTLNELLVAMDGFAPNSGVIVMAATNRSDVLDTALLRRFERQIYVPYPDIRGREEIFNLLTSHMNLDSDVNLHLLARSTSGASGSDIKTMVNEAALLAARNNMSKINQMIFESAIDRVVLGLEKKTAIISDDDKLLTAYHESGHALLAFYSENTDDIHKITIVPRGQALGLVAQLPDDKVHMTLQQLKSKLKIALAGRAAEIFKYGTEYATTGASSDIKYATNIALHMFTVWGFSPNLGPVHYELNGYYSSLSMSDKCKEDIFNEVKKILQWAQEEASQTIKKYEDKFELLTKTLIEHETLTGEQVRQLFEDGKLSEIKSQSDNESVKRRRRVKTEKQTEV